MAEDKKIEKLIKQLGSPRWDIISQARDVLGKDKTAVPHLIKALSNYDWSVRQYAAEALSKLGDPSGVLYLINDLSNSGSNWVVVRQSAANLLAKL